jgi:signal transduction histidine kinase
MHGLEDLIQERLLEGTEFKDKPAASRDLPRVIPHEVITAAQSLQPYAKSLSHELRTPMQGVVGMLDVMYATVQEAAEGQTNADVRKVFETLKDNIETVQGKFFVNLLTTACMLIFH